MSHRHSTDPCEQCLLEGCQSRVTVREPPARMGIGWNVASRNDGRLLTSTATASENAVYRSARSTIEGVLCSRDYTRNFIRVPRSPRFWPSSDEKRACRLWHFRLLYHSRDDKKDTIFDETITLNWRFFARSVRPVKARCYIENLDVWIMAVNVITQLFSCHAPTSRFGL